MTTLITATKETKISETVLFLYSVEHKWFESCLMLTVTFFAALGLLLRSRPRDPGGI